MLHQEIDIVVTPVPGDRSYRLSISRRSILLLLVAVVLVLVGLIIALVNYGRIASLAGHAKSLEAENVLLQSQNDRVVNLKDEIDRLRSFEAKMLTIMGIDTLGLGRLRYEEVWAEGRKADSLRAARSEGELTWPLRGAISRGYRPSGPPGTPHLGLDIAGETGAPVNAALSGLVRFAGVDSIFGNMIVLEHKGGLTTVYGHNSQLLVNIGDTVEAGETIARLGNTGRSSAPHLHFEVREGDNAVDPLKYLQTE